MREFHPPPGWDHLDYTSDSPYVKPRPFSTVEQFGDFAEEMNALCRKHGVELNGHVALRGSRFTFWIIANGTSWEIQQ
jgi:hypothetical protein